MTKEVHTENGQHTAAIDSKSSIEEVDSKIKATIDVKAGSKVHAKQSVSLSKNFILVFGLIAGILTAGYFGTVHMQKHDMIPELDEYMKMNHVQQYFEGLKEMLPDTVQKFLDETEGEKLHDPSEDFAIGKLMKQQGLKMKFPVVMIPGVTSTGIESWSLEGTPDCPSERHFRKRLWGSFYMVKTMVMDKACWLKHIMLDPETGLDPPGIKLRSSQGFEASDYFITGYWIWSKILENLAVLGYDSTSMLSAAYDWRLAYLDLERRDGYFSQLKSQIELAKKLHGQKSVLFGHSMGTQVLFYFLKWVEAEGEHFGNGGPNWVNDNIEAYVNIADCLLGAPKALPALISGEMKDTIQLNPMAMKALEKFMSRHERITLLKSFGGVPSMIPKGGEFIWGNTTSSPDDMFSNNTDTLGKFITFSEDASIYSNQNLTVSGAIDFLLGQGPNWFSNRVQEQYSFGISKNEEELKANEKQFNKWINPLEVPLPNAPDMKIYCFYGVGNPTERSYIYHEDPEKELSKMNYTVDFDEKNAVRLADGDGTVSLMSHTMCHKWAQKGHNIYNPGNSNVTIVEMKHEPDKFDIRGGAKTAEHVDILGSAVLNELLLKVAAGEGDSIESKYVTKLHELVDQLDW
ncbi:unnamed protein product [Ambrosiozyma monospora]|uniref:Unnamed protein product n=2 Tax=Ambrosiozyma monospora TaxID=43982 RepID=A0ACB5SU44_AMBMO|nr:unnamed protein product [Ambrosiozyma monospora]